ncbi:MAG: glycosyltransferase [Firmicutes bacterium]|nr:glycosyltransferase [Bacillota bacterium]
MYPSEFGRKLLDLVVLILWIVIVAALVRLKLHQLNFLRNDPVFESYSLLTTSYLLSRILCLLFYHPYHPYHSGHPGHLRRRTEQKEQKAEVSCDFCPSVTIVIPTMNEEKAIFGTIEACCSLDYPEDRLEIIVINDGSRDGTWREIARAMDIFPQVKAVNWTANRGKRAGMVEGIRRSQSEIIVFIDSDSVVEPGSLKALVQPFVDSNVAAVVGHADVLNKDRNLLTRMQAVRYFISFRIMKASESVFNSVTCCSGCYSAYRRNAVLGVLNEWQNQTFLGRKCTFGDDRSLTNLLLREGYSLLYVSEARVKTIVPETWRGYFKQQLRWKKSWFRESLIAVTHMWRRNPGASIPYYLSVLFTFCSPLVLVRSLVLSAASRWGYLGGLAILGALYGLYYRIHRRDGLWPYAFVFVFLNAFVFSWQIYQAILTSTNTSWGTRQVRQALNTKAVEAER